jgi:hypothetical protein
MAIADNDDNDSLGSLSISVYSGDEGGEYE